MASSGKDDSGGVEFCPRTAADLLPPGEADLGTAEVRELNQREKWKGGSLAAPVAWTHRLYRLPNAGPVERSAQRQVPATKPRFARGCGGCRGADPLRLPAGRASLGGSDAQTSGFFVRRLRWLGTVSNSSSSVNQRSTIGRIVARHNCGPRKPTEWDARVGRNNTYQSVSLHRNVARAPSRIV